MKTTEENNRLIAEFMGLKMIKESEITEATNVTEYCFNPRYHTSWDWLMSVVDKIQFLEYGDYITEFSITKDNVRLVTQVNSKVREKLKLNNKVLNVNIYYFDVENLSKLQATYQAVIQFIEWYNSQS